MLTCEDFKNKQSCKVMGDMTLKYNYYKSYQGPDQKSGAYIFRPEETTINGSIQYSTILHATVYTGNLMTLISIEGDKINTYVKYYNVSNISSLANNLVELETFIKPIDVSDHQGKEITMNVVRPDVVNKGIFYTDANGLDL